jgi:hypothetical protein
MNFMATGKTVSSIIFLLIVLVIIYGAIKIFALKEPIGINAIDKLIPGSANNLLFAKWERIDDPTYKLGFFSNGTWKSSFAAGSFTAFGSKCLKLDITASASNIDKLPSKTYYVVIQSLAENELSTAECQNGCSGCTNPMYHYRKVKYEEIKINKEFNPDNALDN